MPAAEWDSDSGLGTRPTAEQVLGAITGDAADLANIIGVDIPEKYRDAARNVVALHVALFIELTYYPEQINSNRSPYEQLKDLYDEMLANLLTSMGISTDQDDGGAVPVDAGYPSYGGFPLTGIGMEQPL